jgi:hypothetical protein
VSHSAFVLLRALLVGVLAAMICQAALALPVVPGAVGFGTDTPAGRGGVVIHVTSLADSGNGTLRAALAQNTGGQPRVIVFDVSGIITLTSHLKVSQANTTIAGQTAPHPGIMLRGADLTVQASNVLVQHISSRPSDDMPGPALNQRSGFQAGVGGTMSSIENVVFDHVSVGWAPDQSFLVWSSGDTAMTNLTVSNSLMSEGLLHTAHPDPEDEHSTGPLFGAGAHNITMFRDISAFNKIRNPLVNTDATGVQIVNNFFYWPGTERARFHVQSDDFPEWTQVSSFHGNAYISLPSQTNAFVAKVSTAGDRTLEFWHDDNHIFMTNTGIWYPMQGQTKWDVVEIVSGTNLVQLGSEPAVFPSLPALPAMQVEPHVIATAGARSAFRDPADARVIADIETRAPRTVGYDNFYVSDPESAVTGGYPNWTLISEPFPELPTDAGDSDSDGYTNLEERLHQLAFRLEGDRRIARFDDFEVSGTQKWLLDSGTWAVTAAETNVLNQSSTSGNARAYLLKSYFYDQVVQAKLRIGQFNGTNRFVRVDARVRDAGNSYYVTLRNNNRVEIKKLINGVSQVLDFEDFPVTAGSRYDVRLSVVGGALSATVKNLETNATVNLSYTDPNPLPPGFAGVGGYFASAWFDNVFVSPTGTAVPQVTDNFDDTNANGWNPTGGGNWTVASRRYRQSLNTVSLLTRAVWNAPVAGPNQSVQATVDPMQFNGTSFVSVHARYVDANESYYVTLRNTGRLEVKKLQGGVVQMTDFWDPDHALFDPTQPHTLKIEVTGTGDPVLVGYLDGVPLVTLTDTSDTPITAANQAALGTFGASAEFDDVIVSSP